MLFQIIAHSTHYIYWICFCYKSINRLSAILFANTRIQFICGSLVHLVRCSLENYYSIADVAEFGFMQRGFFSLLPKPLPFAISYHKGAISNKPKSFVFSQIHFLRFVLLHFHFIVCGLCESNFSTLLFYLHSIGVARYNCILLFFLPNGQPIRPVYQFANSSIR